MSSIELRRILSKLRDMAADANADGKPLSSDPGFQSKYNALEITCEAMEGSEQRVLNQLDAGETPGTVSSVLNAISSETLQRADELCVEVAAHYGMPYQPGALEVGGPEAIGSEIYLTAMPSFPKQPYADNRWWFCRSAEETSLLRPSCSYNPCCSYKSARAPA